MEYDEEEFKDFKQHLMSGHGDFSVFFGSDYVAFAYGDGEMFPIGWDAPDEETPVKYNRLMGIVTMSQVLTMVGGDVAGEQIK